MNSPSQDPKLSLMALPSMDDDGLSQPNSPVSTRFTPMLTPTTALPSPKITAPLGVTIDRPPKIHITLLSRKLVTFVMATCLFLAVFSGVTYYGVVVFTKVQASNNEKETKDIEGKVELFNAFSGFLIALVEVMLGVYMSNFLPAFQVYLHNMLWFLHGGARATKFSNGARSFLMFVFPVFLMLVIGQCLRSFQASQSSVGFETHMNIEDLSFDESVVESLKLQVVKSELEGMASAEGNDDNDDADDTAPERVDLKVLRSAVNGYAAPLDVTAKSNCSSKRSNYGVGLTDLDSTNVAFGFPAQEWYSEMVDFKINGTALRRITHAQLTKAINTKTPLKAPDFNLTLASDMYATAKIVLDRFVAESQVNYAECTDFKDMALETLMQDAVTAKTDAKKQRTKCDAAYRTLFEVGNFQAADEANRTVENLGVLIENTLSVAVDRFRKGTLNLYFSRLNVTDQVDADSFIIEFDTEINKTNSPFFSSSTSKVYSYGSYAQELCGASDCVFFDTNNQVELPRQVIMVPYEKNCKYNADSIKYVRDVRSFMPTQCEKEPNSALVVSIASFIRADYYTSNLTKVNSKYPSTPGVVNPMRRMRLAINRVTWKTADLLDRFKSDGVVCVRGEGKSCKGLSYRLTKTGRHVIVGEDALPTKEIMNASLAVPIRLLQLNQARFYAPVDLPKTPAPTDDLAEFKMLVTPERLAYSLGKRNYKKWNWVKKLEEGECSSYMDAYIRHINENWLYIERPTDVLYRSAVFYLFSKASVTAINNTELAMKAAAGNTTVGAELGKLLVNLKLEGDTQYRDISVKVPWGTFFATIVGCGILLLIAVLIVLFPKRPMEYFAPTVTTPDKFIVLKNREKYPDVVHTKTLLFPATGESLPMDDFDVDEMTLVNRTDQNDELKFWDWGQY